MKSADLVRFDVAHGETDLAVFACRDLSREAAGLVAALRGRIESYGAGHEGFFEALEPLECAHDAPEIVRRMCTAATEWQVGPMAAVAGALARGVGEGLLEMTGEVIVENGGDIFLVTSRPRRIAVYAGPESPFGDTLAIEVSPESGVTGVCSSSGTVGHSFSRGRADAVVALAETAEAADAAATAICNRVLDAADVERIIEDERRRGLLMGLVIVIEDKLGAFGAVKFV